MKIALIGAGSREFGPATLRDIYLSEPLARHRVAVALMDRDAGELATTRAYAESLSERTELCHDISATTDLGEALDGADFVVMAIEVNRYFYWAQDFHVPRRYGFRQVYGENGGPGGLFHALRNMGPSVEIARDMEARCPEAWLLNYTNPLTKLCEAQTRLTGARVVGLCHGICHGKEQVCRLIERPPEDLRAYASGLNHFTWFQELRSRSAGGEDLYPLLKKKEREACWLSDWDEIALSRILLRCFGLFPSPGANHIGEYIRWAEDFLGSSLLQFFYDPREGDPWETGDVPTWLYNLSDHPTDAPLFPEKPLQRLKPSREDRIAGDGELHPSGELAVPIIEGLACGVKRELPAVNVPNHGWVPGLPDGAVVEVPATVGPDGLQPRAMERLPEAVLALLRPQVSINTLLVDAYAESSRSTLLQALLLDPTCHSYRQAVHLIDRMFELQADILPAMEWEG